MFGLYKREKVNHFKLWLIPFRIQLNRVALTTAVAARRAMELSLIPEVMMIENGFVIRIFRRWKAEVGDATPEWKQPQQRR